MNDKTNDQPVEALVIDDLIGGYLEAVGGDGTTWIAYGDEEGALKHQAPNVYAAQLLHVLRRDYQHVPLGRVMFLGLRYKGMEDGYTETDVPLDVKAALSSLY